MRHRMKKQLGSMDEISRRNFLCASAKMCLGVGVMPWLTAPLGFAGQTGGKAKHIIYLYMQGGMSHIDTFDPKPGADSQGEFGTVGTSVSGIKLSSTLPKLAKQMNKMAIIRSMHSREGSHERGRYLMHTNYNILGTVQHPHVGAWTTRLKGRINDNLPGSVVIGNNYGVGSALLGTKHELLQIGRASAGLQNLHRSKNVDKAHFEKRLKLAHDLDHAFQEKYDQRLVNTYAQYYEEAVRMMGSKDAEAFDISKEHKAVKAAYGNDNFGQGCLLARRLVEQGVRFVEVSLNGWDTHDDNFEKLSKLNARLDRSVSVLLSDLESRGLLDETLVVIASEFGRSPKINGRKGRDHHPKAFSCVLAGGGIRGGQVYGQTDKRGHEVHTNGVEVKDLFATIGHAMGFKNEKEVYSPAGRPFTFGHGGKPLLNLFG